MYTNKRLALGVVLAVILLMLFGAYRGEEQHTGGIKIGVMLPLTGQYAALGESARDAILLSAHGDKELTFVFEDTAFDATKAVSAYTKLKSADHVDALMNLDTVSLSAIQPLVEKDGIPVLQLSESGFHLEDTVFQMMPYSYPLYAALGENASHMFRRIALVYTNSDPFTTDASFFRQGAQVGEIVYEVKLAPGADYRTEVTKLKAARVDAVTVFLAEDDGIRFLSALKAQEGSGITKLICDANIEITIGAYLKALGPDLFEGCISTNLPNLMTPTYIAAYKAAYTADPQFASDYAYDAVTLLKGLEKIEEKDWMTTIASTSFDGVSGHIEFDENGTRLPAIARHVFKNGSFVDY